jgi:3-oxoacyl-[acyl-carrier-protein] synthase II
MAARLALSSIARQQLARLHPGSTRTGLLSGQHQATACFHAHAAHSTPLPPLPAHAPRPLRRVVVTGLGCVTPLGCTPGQLWQRLLAGETGVRTITDPAVTALELSCKVAADVRRGTDRAAGEFDLAVAVPKEIRSQTSPFIHFALSAAAQALTHSGYSITSTAQAERSGVAFGSGIGCVEESASAGLAMKEKGKRGLSAYSIPKLLVNLAAGQISIRHNFRGPNHAVATACTTGAHSIGDAFNFIRSGAADVMLAGSSEASVTPLSLALFSRIRALSTTSDPSRASRPFDSGRDGFVMGEGAGAMLLEDLDHAKQRGARILAEIRGYGLSGDASHITAPHESGRGSLACMQAALRDAMLRPEDIDYINAHATSTPLGDRVEASAIRSLFFPSDGPSSSPAPTSGPSVSSTKGALGHMLGAAGSVEALICVLALQHQQLPPNLRLESLEEAMQGVRYVGAQAEKRPVRAAMSNSFGFGGTNASIVITQYQP